MSDHLYQYTVAQWERLRADFREQADRAEAAEYELKLWKEVEASRPDWKKLWEEQTERAEAAEAEVERLKGALAGRDGTIAHLDRKLDDALDEVERLKAKP